MTEKKHQIGELDGGWAFMLKLALLLVVPGIGSQLWMAKSVWVMDVSLKFLTQSVEELHGSHAILSTRLSVLEKDLEKHTITKP